MEDQEEQEEQEQQEEQEGQQPQQSSKTQNPLFWVLAAVIIFLNLIPDGIDILLNLFNLTGIALLMTTPIVWVINFSVGLVTFLILLILGGSKFRSIAKRVVTYLIGVFLEGIPFVNFLPLKTISVILAIIMTVAEEKFSNVASKIEEAKEKIS